MEAYKIYIQILRNPNSIKHYNELINYYSAKHMQNEAEAIIYLLEKKFRENENHHPNSDQKQQENN